MNLWDNKIEIQFFKSVLKNCAMLEKLFYNLNSSYYAYVPKNYDAQGQTLQARNALVGHFAKKWTRGILAPIAEKF